MSVETCWYCNKPVTNHNEHCAYVTNPLRTYQDHQGAKDALREALTELTEAREEIQRLTESLSFYADPENWKGPNRWDHEKGEYKLDVSRDFGRIARKALGLPEEPDA